MTQSGFYTIQAWDVYTQRIQTTLYDLWRGLRPALRDVPYGTASPAYNASRSDTSYIPPPLLPNTCG